MRAMRHLMHAVLIGGTALAATALGASTAGAATIAVTALPANVRMAVADTVSVGVANSPLCPGAGWTLKASVPGKQDAVLLSGFQCNGTTLVGSLTKNPSSAKKNAVVKLVATNSATSQSVTDQVVVHVKMKGGKPTSS